MSHPLQQRVRAVGLLARLLLIVRGMAWVIALVAAAAFAFGVLDYCVRSQDAGVRLIFSLLVVTVLIVAAYFFLLPAFFVRRSEIEIARRIERRYPRMLGDRLSSTIAFLGQSQDDPTAGSATLRRAVVAETVAIVEQLNLFRAIDYRKALRAVLLAALICEVVAGVSLLDADSASLAAQRLVNPWSDAAWPRRNNLYLVQPPPKLSKGDDLKVVVADRSGRLPDKVTLFYKYEGDERQQQRALKFFNGVAIARIENVTRNLQYRAEGGDDYTMEWTALEVVEPPQITTMQVTLHPPAYTNWPVETSGDHIRALEGTRIEIAGQTDKPLVEAKLKVEIGDKVRTLPVRVSDDGLSFAVPADINEPWLIDGSGSYYFDLIGTERIAHAAIKRWQIRAITERPPNVLLETPTANSFLTVNAIVDLRGTVKDDLAIQSIDVQYAHMRSDSSETQPNERKVISLFKANGIPVVTTSRDSTEENNSGATKPIDFTWDLSTLAGLQRGDVISFEVAASDFKPQIGQSTERRLVIISADELEDRITQRQSAILGLLADVLRLQKEARAQTKSIEIQFAETGRLTKVEVDQVQSAELSQRQVHRLLAEGDDSVAAQLAMLIADLDNNRLDNPDIRRRMTDLLADVRRLEREHLTAIQRELVESLKVGRAVLESREQNVGANADSFAGNIFPVQQSLTEAGIEQDQVISILEQILNELTPWDNYRRFSREISRARREQEEIASLTDEHRLATLGKSFDELSPQERANLRMLAERQFELARGLEKLQGRMQQMRTELQATEPLAAETLADALDTMRRLAVSGQMRESAGAIQENRLGQAAELEQDVIEGLDELIDSLSNRREHELERLAEKLREAADELEGLRERAEELREQMQRAADNENEQQRRDELMRLSKQQREMAEEINRLSRRLMRLRADRASETSQQAGSKIDASANSAEQGDADAAQSGADEAQELLDESQRNLEERIRQTEQELFQEQMARLADEISGLVVRQQAVLDRTLALDDLRLPDGQFERSVQVSVRDLAREQRGLSAETEAMANKVAQAAAFELGLRGVAGQLSRAAARLDRFDTGAETQQAERVALARLEQLREALKPVPPAESGDEQGSSGQQGEPLSAEAIQVIAQLKLLQLMQGEINRRTAELETARLRMDGELNGEQQQELDELAREQGRLADLILELSQPLMEKPEDDPENLPEIRREDKLDAPEDLEDELDSLLRERAS